MSYYYNYYIGFRAPDADKKSKSGFKFFALGPFDYNGCLMNVLSRSRNGSSDLHNDFYVLDAHEMSDQLKKAYLTTCDDDPKTWDISKYDDDYFQKEMRWLPLSSLPKGEYLKSGYYLISDVSRYEEEKDRNGYVYDFDGFHERITPVVYAAKLQAEIISNSGKIAVRERDNNNCVNEEEADCSDEDTGHRASDYCFYAYPDYDSKEYEASVIRDVVSLFQYASRLPKNAEIVILETEG